MKQINIHSQLGGNAAILSNLYPKPFLMDGEFFGSIEGFLQGLRVKDISRQKEIFAKSGIDAKKVGRAFPIKNDTLYYRGKQFNRYSDYYQVLLKEAYLHCYYQCDIFKQAIKDTKDCEFIHSIGKDDMSQTILTNSEFINNLYSLRDEL